VHVTSPTTRDSCGTLDNTATAVATSDEVSVSDAATTTVACAGVTLDKLGPAEVRHGDPLNYTFEVANAGGDGLTSPVVTDDHCTVGANTTARRNDDGDEQLETPGVDGAASEIWVYACTGTVPAHTDGEPNPIHNVANVTASASLERSLTATDSHDTRIVHAAAVVPGATAHPAVHITNDAPDNADAGDRITYRLTVTNPGDVPLVGEAVAVTDDDCDAPPVLLTRGEDTTPGTLDPGDTWIYTCTTRVAKDAGARRAPRQARLRIDNLATVTATAATGALVSDADGVSTFVSRGNVAPSQTTPSGTARLRGPSGCVRDAFVARVSGRSIRRVTVKVDGRVVKRFKKAANRYRYRVRPGRFGDGLHRLSARVAFLSGSGTRPRTLRMVFERCQRPVIVPPFTG
jgi:uncharacterized repeat protein (TIGR01451 family)